MKFKNILSFLFFIFAAVLWTLWIDDELIIYVTAGLTIVGMITAFLTKNRSLAVIGFMGNLAVFFIAIIFPYLMSLI